MPFSWFVALRYMREQRGQTALIMAAVSVGVSVVVFLSALITGLQASLIDKTLGSQPHITLRVPRERPRVLIAEGGDRVVARTVEPAPARMRSIDEWPKTMMHVEAFSGVEAVSAGVSGSGYLGRAGVRLPATLRGVDAERFVRIIDIPAHLVAGSFDVSGANVVIGASLAEDLSVSVGDTVRITSSEGVEDTSTVAGIMRLGSEAVDHAWVLTSIRHAQALFGLPGGATEIEIKVRDVFSAESIAQEIDRGTELDAESWMVQNAELLAGLSAQSSSKTMIQFFVIVAVALGIASVLIVSVVQKSREIGILRAVGTPRRRVLGVFLIQGLVLGLAGSVVGCGLGAFFAKAFERFAVDAAGEPRFPVALTPELFASATLLAVGVGLLSALLPARRASRLDPVVAIRNG